MSSKYSVLPPSKVVKAMGKLGFEKCSQKVRHAKYINYQTGKIFIILMQNEIAKATFKSVLEQADIELEEFFLNL
ncbi:MAG: type II toxin-antitoxin system HicA family toxin [Clostridia bacterium]|nr:type II toxin-antitoxin system HicA family toxin [Clostridia bacterium]